MPNEVSLTVHHGSLTALSAKHLGLGAGHGAEVIRIADLPHKYRNPLRVFLSNRFGGAPKNILRVKSLVGHVALWGNVYEFLKGTRVSVRLERDDGRRVRALQIGSA